MGIGAGAVGGAITAVSMNREENKVTMKGAAIGALVGGVAGYVLHRIIDNKEDKVRRETLFNLESHGIAANFNSAKMKKFNTFMTSPEVREDYIETHTINDGRRLIQGHKTWTILGNPQFNLSRPKMEGGN
jgi:hypothetical protein